MQIPEANSPTSAQPSVVILLIGLTGAGKTSFINALTGANLPVGNSLQACTQTTNKTLCQICGVDIEFIDTPGFDATGVSDASVLMDITHWIKSQYRYARRVVGALYLYSIQNVRMHGSALRTLRLFNKFVGAGSMSHVGLLSTDWNTTPADIAELSECGLHRGAWANMIEAGATTYRCWNDFESGLRIVADFVPKPPMLMRIQ